MPKTISAVKTVALSIYLSKGHLEKILPKTVLESEKLDCIFEEAREVLECDTDLSSYIKKICFTHLDNAFSIPKPDPQVVETVTKALYKNKRFWVEYRSVNINYNRTYFVNPLALVYCSDVPYVVCTLFDGENIIYLALHRMSNPRIAPVNVTTPPGFNLDDYTKSGVFKFDINDPPITIKAILSGDAVKYFEERQSSRTRLTPTNNGKVELEAEVEDSIDIRQLLRGFGNAIDVLEPPYLRNEIHQDLIYDALTGLFNRKEFDFRLEYEIERHQRSGLCFALLLLDIDHFKRVNDTYGHPDGDAVLKEFAKRIKESVRKIDYCFRYGGEEFAVILPDVSYRTGIAISEATLIAERIRSAVSSNPFSLPNSKTNIHITVSIGIAIFPHYSNAVDLKQQADKYLYAAKKAGRNCVVCLGFSEYTPSNDEKKLIDTLMEIMKTDGGFLNALLPKIFISYELPPIFIKKYPELAQEVYEQRDRYDERGESRISKNTECSLPDSITIEELLGCYEPKNERIMIYQRGIDWCVKRYKFDQKWLSAVVLIHEIGHWITHLLPKNKIPTWKTDLYTKVETDVHEGFAQLMTWWVADKVGGDFENTFEQLNTNQSSPYKVYEKFTNEPINKILNSLVKLRLLQSPATLQDWKDNL